MATISIASVSILGGSHLKSHELWSTKCNSLGNTSRLTYKRKSNQLQTNRNLSVRVEYNDCRGGGGDFVAGFLVGSALFGTLAYIFAPQKTRQTLNAKISQLNSAIDNVSSRLRGGNNMPAVPITSDPEEATM